MNVFDLVELVKTLSGLIVMLADMARTAGGDMWGFATLLGLDDEITRCETLYPGVIYDRATYVISYVFEVLVWVASDYAIDLHLTDAYDICSPDQ